MAITWPRVDLHLPFQPDWIYESGAEYPGKTLQFGNGAKQFVATGPKRRTWEIGWNSLDRAKRDQLEVFIDQCHGAARQFTFYDHTRGAHFQVRLTSSGYSLEHRNAYRFKYRMSIEEAL